MLGRSICVLAAVALFGVPDAALAQDAKGCKLQKVVEWKVRSIGRHMAVEGAINGKKIGIVLDTGASVSMLFRAAAKRLDLSLTEARGQRMYGIGGETKVEIASVDEFKLGEAVVRDTQFRVAGERDPGEGFDLLLGEDFLRNFDIEFDLKNGTVRLWQAKDCDGASLAYWTKEVVGEVPIEPITDAKRRIDFTVQLNGKPVEAFLDSGASTSVVTKHDAEAVGATMVGATFGSSGVGAKTVDAAIGKFERFAIGNQEIRDVEIRVADIYQGATRQSTGSRIAKHVLQHQPMILGADFLRAHRTLVSHSQRKMYFSYVGGPAFVTRRTSAPAQSAAAEKAKAD